MCTTLDSCRGASESNSKLYIICEFCEIFNTNVNHLELHQKSQARHLGYFWNQHVTKPTIGWITINKGGCAPHKRFLALSFGAQWSWLYFWWCNTNNSSILEKKNKMEISCKATRYNPTLIIHHYWIVVLIHPNNMMHLIDPNNMTMTLLIWHF